MLSMKMQLDFDTILIATGSEVNLAVSAAKELASQGAKVRVVSMPSTDVFDKQDVAYKEEILPNAVRRRVAVEMGATQNWYKYVGLDGAVLGIDTFGASAPAPKVLAEYGFTVEKSCKSRSKFEIILKIRAQALVFLVRKARYNLVKVAEI